MNLRYMLLGLVAVTFLSACGADEPAPAADTGAAEAEPETVEDMPDLIIPENE